MDEAEGEKKINERSNKLEHKLEQRKSRSLSCTDTSIPYTRLVYAYTKNMRFAQLGAVNYVNTQNQHGFRLNRSINETNRVISTDGNCV